MNINITKHLLGSFFLITTLNFTAYSMSKNYTYITLVNGSLVEQVFPEKNCAAIVNAANEKLLGGGGIDGIIWNEVAKANSQEISGTNEFQAQCHVLRRKKKAQDGCNPNRYRGDIDQIAVGSESSYVAGEAGLTQAFGKLANNVGYVIHAVGPRGAHPTELRDAYQNSLDRAAEAKMKVIAFCPISTGI